MKSELLSSDLLIARIELFDQKFHFGYKVTLNLGMEIYETYIISAKNVEVNTAKMLWNAIFGVVNTKLSLSDERKSNGFYSLTLQTYW